MSLTAMVDGATQVTGAMAAAKATVWEEGWWSIPLSNGGIVVAELPMDENRADSEKSTVVCVERYSPVSDAGPGMSRENLHLRPSSY
jgi:hypothetical protein